MASADGPIKDLRPARHQGLSPLPPRRPLLTLEDTVEFFNLILGLALNTEEKTDLVAFMRNCRRESTFRKIWRAPDAPGLSCAQPALDTGYPPQRSGLI